MSGDLTELKKIIFIKRLEQESHTSFIVYWSDGMQSSFRLGDLQSACTCASCREHPPISVPPDQGAKKIETVGRYALRIDFLSGCSHGIFSFDFLRNFKPKTTKKERIVCNK